MKKAIITGCTGCIGVALINELVANGVEVTAVIRENSSRKDAIPGGVKIVECSLDNIRELPRLLPNDYDVFYHFAWDGTIGQSRNDFKLQCDNIKHSIEAVNAAKALGCKRFIGAGSQAEYGRADGVLTPETPCNPENGYGIAKLAAGNMTRLECERIGIEHVWTRILSVYGPNDGSATMITSGILDMLSGITPEFTKGEQMWDYLYCSDAARAMRLIAEKGKNGAVYCIGGGKVEPLSAYIEKMRDAVIKCGKEDAQVNLGAVPYAPKQVMYLCADISALTRDTGFVPEVSFEQGIEKTVNWIRKKYRI
ncbi:MAG: NAD(P)-dependent oxidoreductase [Clostridia bacterium]|nr:NAD(P)-dependent oxidoreductase [Clostridia bacterium]